MGLGWAKKIGRTTCTARPQEPRSSQANTVKRTPFRTLLYQCSLFKFSRFWGAIGLTTYYIFYLTLSYPINLVLNSGSKIRKKINMFFTPVNKGGLHNSGIFLKLKKQTF